MTGTERSKRKNKKAYQTTQLIQAYYTHPSSSVCMLSFMLLNLALAGHALAYGQWQRGAWLISVAIFIGCIWHCLNYATAQANKKPAAENATLVTAHRLTHTFTSVTSGYCGAMLLEQQWQNAHHFNALDIAIFTLLMLLTVHHLVRAVAIRDPNPTASTHPKSRPTGAFSGEGHRLGTGNTWTSWFSSRGRQ